MRASSSLYKERLSRLACFSSALALSGSPALVGAEGILEGTHKGRTSHLFPSERGTSATYEVPLSTLSSGLDRPHPSLSRLQSLLAPRFSVLIELISAEGDSLALGPGSFL